MAEERRSTLSQKITAAAAVATALSAGQAAEEAKKAREELEEINKATRFSAAGQQAIEDQIRLSAKMQEWRDQRMAADQEEANFRITILTALPLFKDEQDKIQYLTEQLLPELGDFTLISPIDQVLAAIKAQKQLASYLDNPESDALKAFLAAGKEITAEQKKWHQSSRERGAAREGLAKAQKELNDRGQLFDAGVYKMQSMPGIWVAFLVGIVIWAWGQSVASAVVSFLAIALVLRAIRGLMERKLRSQNRRIGELKAEIEHLKDGPDESALDRQNRAMATQWEKLMRQWAEFQAQIISYLLKENHQVVFCDAKEAVLSQAHEFLQEQVADVQSFLPPSCRLPVSHFAAKYFCDSDLEAYRKDQLEVKSRLENLIKPDFANGLIVLADDRNNKSNCSGADEELIQQCIEVIRSEQKASVSLLQRRLRLGYTRAVRIMDELEQRSIVGPNKEGSEARDILIDLERQT